MKKTITKLKNFDYIIIGTGVAGFHLAMAISKNPYFDKKTIALIDPNQKNINDKTLSFWEKGNGKWDQCVSNSWNKAYFYGSNKKTTLELDPYTYKTIKALSFYNYCKKSLFALDNFHFINDEVSHIIENTVFTKTKKQYSCTHIFDSRLPVSIEEIKKTNVFIGQSFKGWFIKTDKNIFENTPTMMDYRMQWKNSTSFMYILPFNKKEALFEYTLFTPFSITNAQFDKQIKDYIKKFYPNLNYSIKETESGMIPMSAYDFKNHNTKKVTKIGTAGGWVKASTGYSFKFAEKNAEKIVFQLVKRKPPIGLQQSNRFKFYDKLLLRILANSNHKGAHLFTTIYEKTKLELLFKFLDEETTLIEEVKFISKLPYWPFLKAIFQK